MSCLHLKLFVCDICDEQYCCACQESTFFNKICKQCANNDKFKNLKQIHRLVCEIKETGNIYMFTPFEEFQIYYSGYLKSTLATRSSIIKSLKDYLDRKFS